jgi:hypothetical protein
VIKNETLPYLMSLKQSQEIKHIGISALPLSVLKQMVEELKQKYPGQHVIDFVLTYSKYTLLDNSLVHYGNYFQVRLLKSYFLFGNCGDFPPFWRGCASTKPLEIQEDAPLENLVHFICSDSIHLFKSFHHTTKNVSLKLAEFSVCTANGNLYRKKENLRHEDLHMFLFR